MRSHIAYLLLVLSFASLPTASADSGVTFEDIAATDGAGITYRRVPSPRHALLDAIKVRSTLDADGDGAPGVAIFDYDGDGDLDIYVTNGPGADNSLYRNLLRDTGWLTFVDVTVEAGVAATDQDSAGVCYGDLDNDGDDDLLVPGIALCANRIARGVVSPVMYGQRVAPPV